MASRIVNGKKETCSKNFIDCRKHPNNGFVPTVEQLTEQKIKERESALTEQFKIVSKTYNDAKADPESSNTKVRNASIELRNVRAQYNTTTTGIKQLEQELSALNEAGAKTDDIYQKESELRQARKRKIAVEQEIATKTLEAQEFIELKKHSEDNPMTNYQRDLSSLLKQEARIHTSEHEWGGPSTDYLATQHFKQCGIMAMENVEDNYSWELYDTINSETRYGIKANVTCHCGNEFRRVAVIESQDFSSLLNKMFALNTEQ